MKNFRKNPASLRFMKTFLTAAERLSAAVHRDESDKSPFFVYSTTAALALPPDYLDEFEGESFSFGRDGANGFVLVEKRGKTHISPLGDGRVRLTAQSLDEETARELCAEAREFISSHTK